MGIHEISECDSYLFTDLTSNIIRRKPCVVCIDSNVTFKITTLQLRILGDDIKSCEKIAILNSFKRALYGF